VYDTVPYSADSPLRDAFMHDDAGSVDGVLGAPGAKARQRAECLHAAHQGRRRVERPNYMTDQTDDQGHAMCRDCVKACARSAPPSHHTLSSGQSSESEVPPTTQVQHCGWRPSAAQCSMPLRVLLDLALMCMYSEFCAGRLGDWLAATCCVQGRWIDWYVPILHSHSS